MGDPPKALTDFIKAHPKEALFNADAKERDIVKLEKAMGIQMPALHKRFLLPSTGGFINISGIEPKNKTVATITNCVVWLPIPGNSCDIWA